MKKAMKRMTTMTSSETQYGPRQRCGACGNAEFLRPIRTLAHGRLCPACGKVILALVKVDRYVRTSEDNYADAVLMAAPRCQHDLLPGLRHAHAAKR